MNQNNQTSGQQPVKSIRFGRIEAAIFKHEMDRDGNAVARFNVKIHKRYQDKNGNWQSSNSFFLNELPDVSCAADEAYKHLRLRESEPNEQDAPV